VDAAACGSAPFKAPEAPMGNSSVGTDARMRTARRTDPSALVDPGMMMTAGVSGGIASVDCIARYKAPHGG